MPPLTPENPIQAYIGIGSNLDNPVDQVCRAFRELDRIPETRCVAHSHLYRSEPVGIEKQPDFINAVAHLQTSLTARELLTALQGIENAHGRKRTLRWGPRTLDLDILLYDELVHNDFHLTIPHPRLHERAFVLYPLQDIAPHLVIPGLGALETLVRNCPPLGLERLACATSSIPISL